MKISLVSLGCSKNLVDSELILGSLQKAGHVIVPEQEADAIIVNTCGFIGDAKRESIDTILELSRYKQSGSCSKLIMTGCLVERYSRELKEELPEVDAFWGTGNLLNINEALKSLSPGKIFKNKPGTIYDPDAPRYFLTPNHTSFVKVSEGCSRTCSFCIIPKMRGDMKSRTVESISREFELLSARDCKEVNLIAQDMTSYGRDIGVSLELLLKSLIEVDGIEWIRLHYCYPWGFSDSLVELISNEEKILSYIDMPLQHINDRLLKAMDRKTSTYRIRKIIELLREGISDLTLRTTFIVGFPGETDEEFEELLDFVEDTEFDRVGVFKYSIEEGTRAATLGDQVTEEVKQERYERLMEIQSRISYDKNQGLVGSIQRTIVDEKENGLYLSRMASQAPEVDGITYVSSSRDLDLGEIIEVKITGFDHFDLEGQAVLN